MGRRHIPTDVPAGCGMHAVGAGDHARYDIRAVPKVQAYPGGLLGQAGEPVIELEAARRQRSGQEMLEGGAVQGQQRRAHLLGVPLSDRMGPQQRAVPPAAELQGWRHVGRLGQIDAKTSQQPGRITADGDPGADFPKCTVLLENLHRYRFLPQARREREARYAPPTTATSHVRVISAIHHDPAPVTDRCTPASDRLLTPASTADSTATV